MVRWTRHARMVPELNDDAVREVPASSYRIIYEVMGRDVAILAVLHKRRELLPEGIGR